MRSIRKLLTVLTTVLTMTVGLVGLAAPAQAAVTTPISYQEWIIQRNLDENLSAQVPANLLVSVNFNLYLKASVISSFTTGDVIQFRTETTKGEVRSNMGSVYVQGNPTSFNTSQDQAFVYEGGTINAVTVSLNTSLISPSDGIITVTPVLYVNGVKSNLSYTDTFDTTNLSANATVGFTEYADTYAKQVNDKTVTATTTICGDPTSVSSGQAMAGSATVEKDGATLSGSKSHRYFYDGMAYFNFFSNIPTPKPTKLIAISVIQFIPVTSDATGTVYSFDETKSLTVGGVDVTKDCFTSLGTVVKTGTNVYVTGLESINMGGSLTGNPGLSCEATERSTGRRIDVQENVFGNFGVGTAYCQFESFQNGKTYDIIFRLFASGKDGHIAEWTDSWTPTGLVYGPPPTLTGSGAGSAEYESVDNTTGSTFTGTPRTTDGTDGRAGKFVVQRVNDTTLKLSHWGTHGQINFGTASEVQFPDPISDVYTSGGPIQERPQVTWFGDHDKWIYGVTKANSMEVVVGSQNSTTTNQYSIVEADLDAACHAALGNYANFTTYGTNGNNFKLLGVSSSNPIMQIHCMESKTATSSNSPKATKILVELEFSGAVMTPQFITTLDNVGEINPAKPTYNNGEDNFLTCSAITYASNPKSGLTNSDVALVSVAMQQDTENESMCRGESWANPTIAAQILTTFVYVDGSVYQEAAPIALTGEMAKAFNHHSVGFDSLGNVNYLYGTMTSNVQTITLYPINLSGTDKAKFGTGKTLNVDTNVAYDESGNQLSNFVLANGGGDTEKVYAGRFKPYQTIASSVINLSSGDVTTGEVLTINWAYSVINDASTRGLEAEPSGGINYYIQTADTKYSVIHWLPGVDPTLGPSILAGANYTVAVGTKPVATLTSTATTASWAITGGANASLFEVNSSTGALQFKANAVAGTYVVEVTVTDTANGNKTATQTITISVSADAGGGGGGGGEDTTDPVISVVDTTPEVNPGDTAVVTLQADEDVDWSITGGADQNLFNIDENTGALTFKTGAVPGTYVVTVTATDANNNTSTQTITVTVPSEPVAPTIQIPNTVDVNEFGSSDLFELLSNQNVDWEIVSETGIDVSINGNYVSISEPLSGEFDGATIQIRATNPSTGLTQTKTITLNVVPFRVTVDGGVDADGNAEFTLGSNHSPDLLDLLQFVSVDNPAITNVQIVDGKITFTTEPGFKGEVTFNFCLADGECFAEKSLTINIGGDEKKPGHFVSGVNKTKIRWNASSDAERYVIKVNGKVVCRTKNTSCIYKGVIGPKGKVSVTSIDGDGDRTTTRLKAIGSKLGVLWRLKEFGINEYKMKWQQKYQLRILAMEIKAAGFKTIEVVGHTDNIGPTNVDRSLSLARAKEVRAYLQYFLPNVKIKVKAAGRTEPITSNKTGEARAANRRVDIRVG